MMSFLLVALGGALGGMGRFAIANLLAKKYGQQFPWGTLCVNASGALAAGWLLGTQGFPEHATSSLWLISVTGLLGGYTTVSSFSLQTLGLWRSGHSIRAITNIIATLLLGLCMAYVGWLLSGSRS
ncbi:MAG: fluoride efflux transporter CrcB [Halomonadaceae bacterium]|uniref:Fluoride-specific ion channel FluC n=1 Tax=Halomonas colorata TaxID=2742615 RepID=A0ABR9FUY6_9GAMM|nr:fluoride efflux transporter CrcB [Halomonas colorata]MBE0462462.1 fluoride efflux transporter CrcB [Halomonas colorata]